MAVIYKPIDGSEIIIGGTTSTGPFPKYSITRSNNETGDKTRIGSNYSIVISGKIINSPSSDITIAGQMQSDLHLKIIEKLQLSINSNTNYGRLQIVPYGGMPNTIEFLDARLMNVEIPETSEESSGMLDAEYTFTFEATKDISNTGAATLPNIESGEETWDISIDQDVTYEDPEGPPTRTYTITHTVSATGIMSLTSSPSFEYSAWKNAAEWVKTRLVSSPAQAIINDIVNKPDNFTQFSSVYFDEIASSLSTDISTMQFYNHTRTPNINLHEGQYSVTETWQASKMPAIIDMEVNADIDESGYWNMVLSGNITGLDSDSLNNIAVSKIDNAETALSRIEGAAFSICEAYYAGGNELLEYKRAKSIGRNKGTGTITFSYTFKDNIVVVDNAISTEVKVTYKNDDRLEQVIAIIPIIGKSTGPIIQDMGTTPERKKTCTVNALMKPGYWTPKPIQARNVALGYAPEGDGVYRASVTEDHDPYTGSYSVTVEWTF